MAEYIEREAVLADLRESHHKLHGIFDGLKDEREREICEAELITFCEIIMRIKDFPAADVVPVVHGMWDMNAEGDIIVYCNQCMIPQDMPTPVLPALRRKNGR